MNLCGIEHQGIARYYCKAKFIDIQEAKNAKILIKLICKDFIEADDQVGASDNELEAEYNFVRKQWPLLLDILDLPSVYNKSAYNKLDKSLVFCSNTNAFIRRSGVYVYIDADCHNNKSMDAFCNGIKAYFYNKIEAIDWINEDRIDPWMCLLP